MKYNYTVEVTVDNEAVQNTTYKTVETAMHAAKKAVVDQARALQVDEYIARIREGINKGYRALVADYWEEFFSSPAFFEMTSTAPFEEDSGDYVEDIPEEEWDEDDEDYEYEEPPVDLLDDFDCAYRGFDITEFYFGRKLHMETNWFRLPEGRYYNGWSSALESEWGDDYEECVFDMSTLDHHIVVTVSRLTNTTHSENIVMVYRELGSKLKGREEIQWRIRHEYGATVSLKTIGKHLDTLRKLGVPVCYKGINRYTLDCEHGFYLDKGITAEVNPEEVATLGTSVNCILVLFALQSAAVPMRQADIIRWIGENYGVKIGRAAVSRHVDTLTDLYYSIKKTNDGYILK